MEQMVSRWKEGLGGVGRCPCSYMVAIVTAGVLSPQPYQSSRVLQVKGKWDKTNGNKLKTHIKTSNERVDCNSYNIVVI